MEKEMLPHFCYKHRKCVHSTVPAPPAGFCLLGLAPIMKVSMQKFNFRSIHIGAFKLEKLWGQSKGKIVTFPVLHTDILVKLKLQIQVTWKSTHRSLCNSWFVHTSLVLHKECWARNRVLETLSGPTYINHVFCKITNSQNLRKPWS